MKFTIYNKCNERIILYCLISFVFIVKFLTLKEFGFQYVGSDDLVIWQCAFDYSNGIFHEPFFYGQNYNYAFESFISAPLIAIGIPIYITLPIVSSFVGVFPFLLISILLFRKGYSINAFLFLLIPLTLPIEYDIITSISRGFTSGLFFSSFSIFSLLNPYQRKSFIILGISVSVGYIMNPNSLIFSFPICLYLFLINYKKATFYIISILSSIPALIIQYFSKQFYVHNPEYNVHSMWILDFSFESLIDGFSHLDKFFRYLTPVFWSGNWIVVFVIIILGVISIKTNWKKGLSLLLCSLFIFTLLGVNKINDDIGVIFLSSTRMFLAIPLLFGLAIFWTKKEFDAKKNWRIIILTIAISVFLVKISNYSSVINAHTQKENFGPIAIKKLESLKQECSKIQQLTSQYDIELIVFIPNFEYNVPSMEFYNYGCSILEEHSSSSIMNIYERRTWVFQKEKNSVRKNILLFNQNIDKIEEYRRVFDCEIISRNPNMLLIKNNDKNLTELSQIFDFQLKRNTY